MQKKTLSSEFYLIQAKESLLWSGLSLIFALSMVLLSFHLLQFFPLKPIMAHIPWLTFLQDESLSFNFVSTFHGAVIISAPVTFLAITLSVLALHLKQPYIAKAATYLYAIALTIAISFLIVHLNPVEGLSTPHTIVAGVGSLFTTIIALPTIILTRAMAHSLQHYQHRRALELTSQTDTLHNAQKALFWAKIHLFIAIVTLALLPFLLVVSFLWLNLAMGPSIFILFGLTKFVYIILLLSGLIALIAFTFHDYTIGKPTIGDSKRAFKLYVSAMVIAIMLFIIGLNALNLSLISTIIAGWLSLFIVSAALPTIVLMQHAVKLLKAHARQSINMLPMS
ncbi:hypothetical protein PVA45_00080 [Entomospira entomophila]|uniref:Uncharacterized protein n=1 Tax=Entomospira entomophila TaxID=2719988 RepID=A0A968G793_9SPIO|nr:hypothetical protein [Entomospira entomophilus]NIZ39920.1 hypothetical protein [Entomospira entomophilus]WDI35482.1 hypothetical protein PVA45_00080 [Entomospira entomophilus]